MLYPENLVVYSFIIKGKVVWGGGVGGGKTTLFLVLE